MSGHNKWSTIKHKKGAADAKRGKLFTKLIKEIMVAARMGGGDIETNPRLRSAVATAKAANMPSDNISRAVKKGTGELEGVSYENITYEGYGPGGVAILVDALTDNKNRTVAEVRHLFSKHGGTMAEAGAVGWMFDLKGLIRVARASEEGAAVDEDELMMVALEAGAEDLTSDDEDAFEILTQPNDLETVRQAIEEAGMPVLEYSVAKLPQNTVDIDEKQSEQVMRLLDALDDSDDVQKLWFNANLD